MARRSCVPRRLFERVVTGYRRAAHRTAQQFFTGPFTNLVITGLRTPQSITRDIAAIGKAQRFHLVHAEVSALDPVNLSVTTSGQTFHADKIVVSPGISMRWGVIEGLDANRSALMPHAWLGDSQVLTLRDRLKAFPDGGTILIAAPPNPYRCPPGPYERATLFAHVLKRTGRSRTKILIADAKDDFSKSALFKLEWDALYPAGASRLDVRATIKTDDGALIYISYNGMFKDSEETEARAAKGEALTSKDIYFVIAPTMQTSAKKYDWLNAVQCIGKMVSYKNDSYVKYDIFIVR